MSRARTNIESEPTRKNVMEADATISKHAYEMQLRSESRYAIGSLHEQEDAQSVVSNQFSEFLAEQGIQYQSDINTIFREFIEEESKQLAERLNEIWMERRPRDWASKTDKFQSWDEVKNWDRTVPCPKCNHNVDRTSSSNDWKLWNRTKKLLKPLADNSEKLVAEIISLSPIMEERWVNFAKAREAFSQKYDLFNSNEFEKSEQFTQDELDGAFHHDKDLYNTMAHLNYCAHESSSCPSCGEDLWLFTPGHLEKDSPSRYFENISKSALSALISSLLNSKTAQSSRLFTGKILDFDLPTQEETFDDSPYVDETEGFIAHKMLSDIRHGKLDRFLNAIIHCPVDSQYVNKAIIKAAQLRKEGKIQLRAGLVDQNQFAKRRHRAAISGAFQACFPFVGSEEHQIDMTFNLPNGERIGFIESENSLKDSLNALSMIVINRMATELTRLKPSIFFEQTDYQEQEQLKWAKELAAQLLLVIVELDTIVKIRKITPDNNENKKGQSKHKMWNVMFRDSFKDKLFAKFSHLDLDNNIRTGGSLLQHFQTDRIDPMFIPPLQRTKAQHGGGYLTQSGQIKNPLIRNNNNDEMFKIKRFEPSDAAISNINRLQQTSWKINERITDTCMRMLYDRVGEFVTKIQINESKYGYQIDYNGKFPEFSFSQIAEWMETMWIASDIMQSEAKRFWHAWCFDWRGRMYPCSNLLSPQGDDLSRGLLLFGEKENLNESGWKWMRRAIGRFYEGREPQQIEFNEHGIFKWGEIELSQQDCSVWNDIQQKLSTKSWKNIDAVFEDPEMNQLLLRVLTAVVEDPLANQSIWAEGDVFRKKAEGFQRLAISQAYVAALNELNNGNKSPAVSIPIVLDASSNIYQHAAILTQDSEMAKAVNVLPNESNLPSDVYAKVADCVREMWEKENPFLAMGIQGELLESIMDTALDRSIAKKPVMTIGYGSKPDRIHSTLLTHNKEQSGILEWAPFNPEDLSELTPEEERQIWNEYPEENDRSKFLVYKMIAHPNSTLGELRDRIPRHKQQDVAKAIIKSFVGAIDEVLGGHSELKDTLESSRLLVSQALEEPNYTTWVLNDGSTIRNIVHTKTKPRSTMPWVGTNLSEQIRFSILLQSEKRDAGKEKRGLPPNFVHSIDAGHMRNFIEEFSNKCGAGMIWSVHDAFGSHPNHVDSLHAIVTKTFFSTHQSSTGGSHLRSLVTKALKTPLKPRQKTEDAKATEAAIFKLQTRIEKFESQTPKVVFEAISTEDSDDIYLIS